MDKTRAQRHAMRVILRDVNNLTQKIDVNDFIRSVSHRIDEGYQDSQHSSKIYTQGHKHLKRLRE